MRFMATSQLYLLDFAHINLTGAIYNFSQSYRQHQHWLGAYRTNVLYSGRIFVRFNDLEGVFT